MSKRTQVHRKLLLEHKALSDKYKLLRAKLSQVADSESKAEGKSHFVFQLALASIFVF